VAGPPFWSVGGTAAVEPERVRLEVDDHEPPIVFHAAPQRSRERRRVGDVVIDGAHEEDVAAGIRQPRLERRPPHGGHVPQPFGLGPRGERRHRVGGEFGAENPALGSDPAGKGAAESSLTRTDFGHDPPGRDAGEIGHAPRLVCFAPRQKRAEGVIKESGAPRGAEPGCDGNASDRCHVGLLPHVTTATVLAMSGRSEARVRSSSSGTSRTADADHEDR
jgi:hypothetical protein